jgi:hypothetical protein
VFEPTDRDPQRVQIWGTFSIAVAGTGGDVYHAPESGYLYFALPADSRIALDEWKDLNLLLEGGTPPVKEVGRTIRGALAFGKPGPQVRVRTSDEKPESPDVYTPGKGVKVIGAGATVLGLDKSPALEMLSAGKFASRFNYALVDRVVFEPNAERPERIQIWGVFTMGKRDGGSFESPRRGYLYLDLSAGGRANPEVLRQWNDWRLAAGTRQIVGFYIANVLNRQIRLRPADEHPNAPDLGNTVSKSTAIVRSDSEYGPIKSLAGFR